MTKKLLSLILTFMFILPLFVAIGGSFLAPKKSNFDQWDLEYALALKDALGVNPLKAEESPILPEENRYIVRFSDKASLDTIESALEGMDYSPISQSEGRLFALSVESKEFFKENANIIEYSEADGVRTALATVNDPVPMPSYDTMNIYSAWDYEAGDKDIIVAVLDTGVARGHEELLNANILAGYDAISRKAGVNEDTAGHGTAVIGLIASTANNGIGIAGVSHGVTVLPIKVSASGTNIYSSDLIRGIRFAADAGAKIINMSIGGYSHSYAEQEAVNYAKSKGCILIAAAGNGGNTEYAAQPSYPASYEGVISVASCNDSGEHSIFSQTNEFVDISAPGENITVIAVDAEGNSIYRTDSGTSYSCAFVSGIAALAASRVGDARFEGKEFMSLCIDACGWEKDENLGHGVINAAKILESSDFPIVTGVIDGVNYSETVTIGFNRGTAFLGDEQIEDGEAVVANGAHTLIVSEGDKEKIVRFRLDHTPLSYEFREFSSYAYFEFQHGNATLNGFPYKSKDRITASGVHEFILTDGDETVTKTVDLQYFLPTVFGVTDRKIYNTPVEISVVGDGSAYLNGEKFQGRTTVSQSGDYTLTVESGNGAVEKDYKFTIDFDNYTHYDTDYENGKAAVDIANGYICLYGDSLVGVRIYDINNPQKYKHFLSVGRVYDHTFAGDKLYLFGDDGITVIDRTIALTTKESVTATFDSPLITYYTYADDTIYGFGGNEMYVVDLETESTALVDEIGFCCEKAFYRDGMFYLLSPSSDSLVRVYDLVQGRMWQYDTGFSFADAPICFGSGYISIGNRLYNADSGEFVFEFAGDGAIMIAGTRVYTCNRVFDFTTGKEIGSLPFSTSSIVLTKDVNWLFGTKAELASVTKNFGGVYDLGGAAHEPNVLSEPENQTEYRTNLYYKKDMKPQSVVASKSNLYMLFTDSFAVYGMSTEDKKEIPPIYLKYKPERVMCSGEYLIVSFVNAKFIYLAKETDLYSGQYIPFPYACKDVTFFGESIVVAAEDSLITINPHTLVIAEIQVTAKSLGVKDGFLFVLQDGVISKYDQSFTKSEFEIAVTESGNLMPGDAIALDKSLYSAENGELIIRLEDKILAHGGNVVITKKGVYDLDARQYFGKTGVNHLKLSVIGGNNEVIAIGGGRISVNYCAEGDDITTSPNISGIENFGVYLESTTVSYDHGVGYIDGVLHKSGDKVSGVGNHIFLLSLPCGRNLEIRFNIEARLSGIQFVSDSITVSVGEKIALHVLYLPEGARSIPVSYKFDSNGLHIDENGVVSALAVGRYKVTAEAKTEKGVISAETVITVRDDLIAFVAHSGYIIDRNNLLVLGIAPGTKVSDFTAMLATKKRVLITDKNGNAVDDYIGTGDQISLVDEKGNVSDMLYAVITGDTDGDGFITAYDLYVQERILKGYQYSSPFVASADANGNGVLADNDYRTLKKMLFGRIESNLGLPEKGLFGECCIQTVSTVRKGDIIEAAVCISGAKYARGVYGRISYGEGLEFMDGSAVGWESDCFDRDGIISFYAFDEEGEACNSSFKILITLKFKVTAEANEKIGFGTEGFVVSYEDGCKAILCKSKEVLVAPKADSDFLITIANAEDFKFDPNRHEYEIIIPYNNALADISVSHRASQSVSATSLIIPDSGTQTVVITLTEENGTTEFYTITAKKSTEPVIDSNCKLQELEIEGHKLSPVFNPEFFKYSTTVPYGTESITLYYVAQNPAATVVVGDTTLKGEITDVAITVGTPDGESLTYTIRVEMLPPEEKEESTVSEPLPYDGADGTESGNGVTLVVILLVMLLGGAITVAAVILTKKATASKE